MSLSLNDILFLNSYLFYGHECFAYVHVCISSGFLVPKNIREGCQIPQNGVMHGFKRHVGAGN